MAVNNLKRINHLNMNRATPATFKAVPDSPIAGAGIPSSMAVGVFAAHHGEHSKYRSQVEVVLMPGRIVRSKTAERVALLLDSREGRKYLARHGWKEGMAIVMTLPAEPLEDVMGLVSVHPGAVLVAMVDEDSQDLRFIHVSETSAALQVVEESARGMSFGNFVDALELSGVATFRIRYWKYSAVAHILPVFDPSEFQQATVYQRTSTRL